MAVFYLLLESAPSSDFAIVADGFTYVIPEAAIDRLQDGGWLRVVTCRDGSASWATMHGVPYVPGEHEWWEVS